MRQHIIFAALALLAFQSLVDGAPPRRIQVKVVDETGKPVRGATVDARYLETVSQDGKDYYSVRGDLDRGRIVIEGEKESRVLTLNDIQWKPTEGGREFEFATDSSDYTTVSGAAAKHAISLLLGDPYTPPADGNQRDPVVAPNSK